MSAVIYAAIVVMWAVVLVPMWLRRHDAATESKSVDRFSTAMRTLSRRTTSGPGRRYVVMPRRPESSHAAVHVSGAAVAHLEEDVPVVRAEKAAPPPRPVPAARPPRAPRPSRPARSVRSIRMPRLPRIASSGRDRSIVARRRRMLLVLIGVTGLSMVLAAVGVVSWPLQIVVDVILVAFCIHLRAQVRRAVAASRQRRRVAVAPPAAARRPVPAPTASPATASRPVMPAAARYEEPAVPVSWDEQLEGYDEVAQVAAAAAQPAAVADEWESETWEPVPVPRPTYTMKPAAPAVRPPAPRPSAPAPQPEPEVAEVADGVSELDEILERRWAVND